MSEEINRESPWWVLGEGSINSLTRSSRARNQGNEADVGSTAWLLTNAVHGHFEDCFSKALVGWVVRDQSEKSYDILLAAVKNEFACVLGGRLWHDQAAAGNDVDLARSRVDQVGRGRHGQRQLCTQKVAMEYWNLIDDGMTSLEVDDEGNESSPVKGTEMQRQTKRSGRLGLDEVKVGGRRCCCW